MSRLNEVKREQTTFSPKRSKQSGLLWSNLRRTYPPEARIFEKVHSVLIYETMWMVSFSCSMRAGMGSREAWILDALDPAIDAAGLEPEKQVSHLHVPSTAGLSVLTCRTG